MPSISMPSQVSNTHSELSEPKIDNQNTGCRDSRTAGCWDFLQGPSNTSYGFKNTTPKLSTFYLSTRSLEMCTEILGSESGSHIDPSLDICSNATQERQCSSVIKPWRTREICKKMKHTTNFPPPLTSISNGYGVKVQAHRGGGRLVITAIISSSAGRFYLKSERENGRMRVFLHKEYYYRRSEQQLVEKIKENGAKIRCNYNKCGNTSGSKNLTSLPLCLV